MAPLMACHAHLNAGEVTLIDDDVDHIHALSNLKNTSRDYIFSYLYPRYWKNTVFPAVRLPVPVYT